MNWFKTFKNIIFGREIVSQQTKLEIVSIGITIVHFIMLIMFLSLRIWPMTVYNMIVVAYYLYIYKIVRSGSIYSGYIMTFIEIGVQVIFGTLMLGWDVGFFMYVFAIVPLFFFLNLINDDLKRSVTPPLFATLGAMALFAGCYVLSIKVPPRFELEASVTHLLFLYNSILSIFMVGAMSHLFNLEKRYSMLSMTEKNQELDIVASEDPLTGLINRRSMEKKLEAAYELAKSKGTIFSLLMGDIDFFKRINDTYGHDFGDEALKEVADIFRGSVREGDSICRWGGEEFLVLIIGNREDAVSVAERIRSRIEENVIDKDGHEIRFTMTLGTTTYKPGYKIEKLIQQADENLYFGKEHGRNQVVSKEW